MPLNTPPRLVFDALTPADIPALINACNSPAAVSMNVPQPFTAEHAAALVSESAGVTTSCTAGGSVGVSSVAGMAGHSALCPPSSVSSSSDPHASTGRHQIEGAAPAEAGHRSSRPLVIRYAIRPCPLASTISTSTSASTMPDPNSSPADAPSSPTPAASDKSPPLLGTIALRNQPPTGEIGGILLTPGSGGRGVATAAVHFLTRQAWEMGYEKLEWECLAENGRSVALAGRCGFVFKAWGVSYSVVERHVGKRVWVGELVRTPSAEGDTGKEIRSGGEIV